MAVLCGNRFEPPIPKVTIADPSAVNEPTDEYPEAKLSPAGSVDIRSVAI